MRNTRYTGGGGGSGPNPVDGFSLGVKASDSNAAPTDAATFVLAVLEADSNAAPTDALTLNIKGLGDSNAAPTDTRSALVRVWLSGSTGTTNVTSPTNEDGQNNGAVATLTTVAAGATTATLTGLCGVNIGAWAFTTALFRGWFKSVQSLTTSTTTIKAHSSSALFADVTLFSSVAAVTIDHLVGDFTFDLVAAGINTLAKLQSVQIISSTTDTAAGVSPAVLTVDAGSIDLGGVF